VLAVLPFAGERTAEWSDLQSLVRAGTVTEVQVDGELAASSTGFATVGIHWHRGLLDYVTTVRQVRGDESGDALRSADVSAVLHSAPGARLAALQPGLHISRAERESYADATMLGFQVPEILALVCWALMLLGMGILVLGPAPWRATRWAWFWWLGNPVGVAAFLLASGPVPGLPTPSNPDRRLTGGWSFLLMLVVTSLSFTMWGVRVDP
jgi:hypothetical protein